MALADRPRVAAARRVAADVVDAVVLDVLAPPVEHAVYLLERRAMPLLARYLRHRASYATDVEPLTVMRHDREHAEVVGLEARGVIVGLEARGTVLKAAADALEFELPVPSLEPHEPEAYVALTTTGAAR